DAFEDGALARKPGVLFDADGGAGDGGVGVVAVRGIEGVEVAVEDEGRAEDAARANLDSGVGHDARAVEAGAAADDDAGVGSVGDQHILLGVRPGVDVVAEDDAAGSLDDEAAISLEVMTELDTVAQAE